MLLLTECPPCWTQTAHVDEIAVAPVVRPNRIDWAALQSSRSGIYAAIGTSALTVRSVLNLSASPSTSTRIMSPGW
jgi:hypothetical protein